MIEKAFFLAEYSTMNNSGRSVEGVLELAELVSCAKRTMSRVLVIIVSVGYGVVKPRLGNTLSQVAGVGLVYFVFCAIEGLARVSKVKLTVYRHFMNTLVFAAIASVIFMMWSLAYHIFPTCLKDWKELWVDTAFWHVLFCFILVVIVILWRPSVNNQRYAFTPLLDDSEDENDQAFSSFSIFQDDLRWIEDHIPSSLAEHLIMDEDEDKEARELEISKML
ncbi:lung seven transmembrane receptor [Teladorsagia circumcincta]|uniref:Lung seven transmembrane receptor n=1 Tax=Teladorsagia circumcincta TaxID=45464 RepID=A0A2G9V0P9_TELCI|nr:lung seven transmembrane receptor [Teladorsagia circumcincta]